VSDRDEIRAAILAELEVEKVRDDVRLITLRGVPVGRLGQDPESGRWVFDWRGGWLRQRTEHENSEIERAELWAADAIAELYAIERTAIEAGKPWGKSTPPGVEP
jgi:hypothetical protein